MSVYQAPWGRALKWVSALSTALLAVVAGLLPEWWPRILLLAFPLGALPFVVVRYKVQDGVLSVRRLWWDTRFDLAGLQSARFDPEAIKGSLRTCGNGGLYSFTGWYWSRTLGTYRMFVTDLKRTVVLTFGTRRIVVSPDDPEAFVRELTAFAAGRSVVK